MYLGKVGSKYDVAMYKSKQRIVFKIRYTHTHTHTQYLTSAVDTRKDIKMKTTLPPLFFLIYYTLTYTVREIHSTSNNPEHIQITAARSHAPSPYVRCAAHCSLLLAPYTLHLVKPLIPYTKYYTYLGTIQAYLPYSVLCNTSAVSRICMCV